MLSVIVLAFNRFPTAFNYITAYELVSILFFSYFVIHCKVNKVYEDHQKAAYKKYATNIWYNYKSGLTYY